MSACKTVRARLDALLEGELDAALAAELREHLEQCAECRELADALRAISAAGGLMAELEPPPQLAAELASSPCRRWLGLLFEAVDRELDEHNLNRLLSHMEQCSSCRRAWNDLTLVHQVSDAMEAPRALLNRCIAARNRRQRRPLLTSRAATAAAYCLAVAASMIIGNPVILARNPAAVAVQQVTDSVAAEVQDVAADGRGEIRVMLWRAWQWGVHKAAEARTALERLTSDNDSTTDQGERT